MWTVRLVKPTTGTSFRPDYFPRTVHYKKAAKELADEVRRMGGEAVIEPGEAKPRTEGEFE